VSAGDNQVGPAGQALPQPLAALVRDAGGSPLGGITVTWAAASGGGSVSAASSITNASGIATTTRTLGAGAGPHTTTATVGALAATFNAIAQIQGATQISSRFVAPLTDTVLATTVLQPLVALVMNHNNVPVPGVIVTWSASGGGVVSQTVDTTDAGGESQVDYTFGAVAGSYGAQAVVTGLVGSPVSFALTAGPGHPVAIFKTGGDNLIAAPNAQVVHTVTSRDAHGNATNGVTIDWAAAAGGGSITPAQNITGGSGTASATRTLGAGLGAQTATATASALAGAPVVTFTTTASLTVQVGNNFFNPQNITVSQNGAVTWQWQGTTLPHTITWSTAGAPAPEPDRTTGSVSRSFPTLGTFNYACANHPVMTGSVTVVP
jgi:plastocyanin